MNPTIPATPEILAGYCGPIEWALLDAPGPTTWRRGVWGPVGPSSGPEEMGVVRAGDMRGELAIRLPLLHSVAMCHIARWLALKLGVDPGVTAPQWVFVPRFEYHDHGDQSTPAHWRLIAGNETRVFTEEYLVGEDWFLDRLGYKSTGRWPTTVPGILSMSPPEAMAAAVLSIPETPEKAGTTLKEHLEYLKQKDARTAVLAPGQQRGVGGES